MNIPKLKGKMVEKGMSADRLAAAIGIHKSTLYCKLGEERTFTVAEAKAIKDVLGLSVEEASAIFFD